MLQSKYQPLTKEIDELEEMLYYLDGNGEPAVPSPQEQIIYWQTTRQNNDMKRSVKNKS